jgi:hypothetical protein
VQKSNPFSIQGIILGAGVAGIALIVRNSRVVRVSCVYLPGIFALSHLLV